MRRPHQRSLLCGLWAAGVLAACTSAPPHTERPPHVEPRRTAEPVAAAHSAAETASPATSAAVREPTPVASAEPDVPEPPATSAIDLDNEPVPEVPPPKIQILEARERAEKIWRKIIDPSLKDPKLEGPADDAPSCDSVACRWRLTITYDAGAWRTELGFLEIDAGDGTPTFVPADGWDRRWGLDEYRVHRGDERSAIRTVSALPDVKEFCATMKNVYKIGCIVQINQAGRHECEAGADTNNECMWWVMVSEQHEDHTVQWASFVVRPKTFRIEAAADPGCGKITVAHWRAYRRAWQRYEKSGGDAPECPETMP